MFICPHCNKVLKRINNSFMCLNNHCFDISREGYVNLLPVNSRKSKDPGDNANMMLSRRAYLESGYYEPLAVCLVNITKDLPDVEGKTMVDIGCGEGYYTGFVKNELPYLNIFGLDISKSAVKYASKRYKDICFCVASAYKLPFEEDSIDIILRVFAPSLEAELNRVIKSGGYLITVTPGENHLIQLRELIYKEVVSTQAKPLASDGYQKISTKDVKYSLTLKDSCAVNHLLNMTPFGWKIGEDQRSDLLKRTSFEIECDFHIEVFKSLHR